MRPSALLSALVLLLAGQAAHAVELPIRPHLQHTPVWCWGATIAMVAEHLKGFPVEDCQVLAEYDMRLGGPGLCCVQPAACGRTGALHEMDAIMTQIFALQGFYRPGALAWAEVAAAIDAGHPMIAGLTTSSSGHVVVISGYEPPDSVVVLDPMVGRYLVPWATLTANWTYGRWSSTFVVTSPRSTTPSCALMPEQVWMPIPCPGNPYLMCGQQPVTRARLICR